MLLMVMSALFLMSSLGLGLLISARSASQQSAIMLAFLSTMIPGLLLSGFLFPIASMPRPIQLLTYLIPARYFVTILRGIFLKGTGVAALWPHALALTLLGAAIFTAALVRYRRRRV